tara:strand:- start:221 stop:619 length:399 start_codon:yes stop_codon:yes gene_type:complete
VKDKDPHYVVKLEKAIAEKYGKEAIQNPKSGWTPEKEKEYIEQVKKIQEKRNQKQEASEKVETNGFLINKKLLNREQKRNCPVCESYSLEMRDDVYMTKFDCCFKCYIQYVEDREERWETGWRPNTGDRDNG